MRPGSVGRGQQLREVDDVSLRVVNPDLSQPIENFVAVDGFRDRLLSEDVGNVVHRLDHRKVVTVVRDVLHEQAIHLQIIDR